MGWGRNNKGWLPGCLQGDHNKHKNLYFSLTTLLPAPLPPACWEVLCFGGWGPGECDRLLAGWAAWQRVTLGAGSPPTQHQLPSSLLSKPTASVPGLELATCQHPNVSLNLGTRGLPATRRWVWKDAGLWEDAALARTILPRQRKGGMRSRTVTASEEMVNLMLGQPLSASLCRGKVKWATCPQSHYVLGSWLVPYTKNAAWACLCRVCEPMCVFCLPWGNLSSSSRSLRQPAQPIGIIRVYLQQARDL